MLSYAKEIFPHKHPKAVSMSVNIIVIRIILFCNILSKVIAGTLSSSKNRTNIMLITNSHETIKMLTYFISIVTIIRINYLTVAEIMAKSSL